MRCLIGDELVHKTPLAAIEYEERIMTEMRSAPLTDGTDRLAGVD